MQPVHFGPKVRSRASMRRSLCPPVARVVAKRPRYRPPFPLSPTTVSSTFPSGTAERSLSSLASSLSTVVRKLVLVKVNNILTFSFSHSGSPWGAGTIAGADGSRQPSALELEIGGLQGQQFYDTIKKVAH